MTRQTTAPFACDGCGRRLGRTIILTDSEHLVCTGCMGNSHPLHARFYPDCPERWHDLHDHHSASGSRAAIRWVIEAGGYAAMKARQCPPPTNRRREPINIGCGTRRFSAEMGDRS